MTTCPRNTLAIGRGLRVQYRSLTFLFRRLLVFKFAVNREDKCEKGDWVLDWKADIPKYVKADLVDSVQLALTEAEVSSAAKTFSAQQKSEVPHTWSSSPVIMG